MRRGENTQGKMRQDETRHYKKKKTKLEEIM